MMLAGYATVFGAVCNAHLRGRCTVPVVGQGAFSGLLRRGWRPKMLLSHEGREIGSWLKIHEDDHGLHLVGEIDEATERGRLAARMVEDGEATGLSLGGQMKARGKDEIARDVFYIAEVRGWAEVSIVTIPGCPGALIHAFQGPPGELATA